MNLVLCNYAWLEGQENESATSVSPTGIPHIKYPWLDVIIILSVFLLHLFQWHFIQEDLSI